MIDPITQYILEEDQYKAIYWILTEAWMDPKIYGQHTASQFGIKWRIGNLATIDMRKFNSMVDRMVKVARKRAYKAGTVAGDVKSIQGGIKPRSFTGLATVVVAAAIITVAYQGYKRFLSKAAKGCKGESGASKTSCMNRYRVKAMRQQLSDLQQGLQSCEKTMNVMDCKERIQRKIKKIKVKLGEY